MSTLTNYDLEFLKTITTECLNKTERKHDEMVESHLIELSKSKESDVAARISNIMQIINNNETKIIRMSGTLGRISLEIEANHE